MVRTSLHAAATRTTPAAGQAADDDVEEGDNAVDDGSAGGADGVDNGHEHIADGAEDGFDLVVVSIGGCGGGERHMMSRGYLRRRLRRPW